jgi:hypothetical protein
MSRRRRRTTARKPQAERQLRIRGVRRGTPDAKRLSRAFIALALAKAEADAEAQATPVAQRTSRTTAGDAQTSAAEAEENQEAGDVAP